MSKLLPCTVSVVVVLFAPRIVKHAYVHISSESHLFEVVLCALALSRTMWLRTLSLRNYYRSLDQRSDPKQIWSRFMIPDQWSRLLIVVTLVKAFLTF